MITIFWGDFLRKVSIKQTYFYPGTFIRNESAKFYTKIEEDVLNTLEFTISSKSMVQLQEVLAGYISGQLGDCRVPEGPDTLPPHSLHSHSVQ